MTQVSTEGPDLVRAASFYEVTHTEATLDQAPAAVWEVLRNIRRWYTEYEFEVLSGPAYHAGVGLLEGQVIKVSTVRGLPRARPEDVVQPQSYFQTNVKIAPAEEIVIGLRGTTDDWKRYTGFYVWRLAEQGSGTVLTVDGYLEAELIAPLLESELHRYRTELVRNWHRSWGEALQHLRLAVAADAQTPR